MENLTLEALVDEPQKSDVQRERPQVEASRAANVSAWQKRVQAAKKHWDKDFKRMRDNMQLAYAGAPKEWVEADNYVVPIVKRHINQAVASLYAKNPKVLADKKRRLEYTVWDGRQDTLQAALEKMAAAVTPIIDPMTGRPALDPMTGQPVMSAPVDPEAQAIVQEVQAVQQQSKMLKRVCKTMVVLLEYFINEQEPGFKKQLKQLIRRTKICGVGYIFLGYQRLLQKRPEIVAQLEDVTAQIARIESLTADLQDGLLQEDSAEYDELKSLAADLQNKVEIIVREGPVFDFPRSTEIIIDPKCRQLSTLVGAGWFAREFHMPPDEVQEIYKIDIRSNFKAYQKSSDGKNYEASKETTEDCEACVWEIWNKKTRQTFTIIDGYPDFVQEPAAPEVELERFWPLFVLTLNDVEHETEIFPLSDVNDLRHPQMEYNRSRQGRRLHRQANKPKYGTVKGRLSEEDKMKLQSHPDSAILELNALSQGEDINSLIQVIKPSPIDPALYETNSEMEDVYRTVGAQEANLGGTSGATATEASIGEQSRTTALDCNVDDVDGMLSELMRAVGEMCLLTLDVQTVKRIAGVGAEWPQMSRQEIVEQVMVDIKAGSSGRPNAAADLAKMERGMPYLLQISGVKMTPVAEKYAELLDIDVDELIAEGMPSQVALNAMASKMAQGGAPQVGTGDPATDPAQQGAAGGMNAPSPVQNEPGAQPAYPSA